MNTYYLSQNSNYNHEDNDIKLDFLIDNYIDILLKMKHINDGTHFYLKEVFLSYKANKTELKRLKDNNYNEPKQRVLNRLIHDSELILDEYNIISRCKAILEPKKTKVLRKLKPILAFNSFK